VQTGPVDTETEAADGNSGVLSDVLQLLVSEQNQTGNQSGSAGAGFMTPQHGISGGDNSTPISGSSSEPMRFRVLNEIYDDTTEIELEDSDV